LSDRLADGAVMPIVEVMITASRHFPILFACIRRCQRVMMMRESAKQSRGINQQGENSRCWSISHKNAVKIADRAVLPNYTQSKRILIARQVAG
jgi:hypothetical protein